MRLNKIQNHPDVEKIERMWECQWLEMVKSDPRLGAYIEQRIPLKSANLREALKGENSLYLKDVRLLTFVTLYFRRLYLLFSFARRCG